MLRVQFVSLKSSENNRFAAKSNAFLFLEPQTEIMDQNVSKSIPPSRSIAHAILKKTSPSPLFLLSPFTSWPQFKFIGLQCQTMNIYSKVCEHDSFNVFVKLSEKYTRKIIRWLQTRNRGRIQSRNFIRKDYQSHHYPYVASTEFEFKMTNRSREKMDAFEGFVPTRKKPLGPNFPSRITVITGLWLIHRQINDIQTWSMVF